MRIIKYIAFSMGSLTAYVSIAQQKIDTSGIKTQLAFIYERDQKTRHGDSVKYIRYIDSLNQKYVTTLIDTYGWPGKNFLGGMGNYTVFLVIQHADLPIQEKYLPLMMRSVADSQSRLCDLALLHDRVLMRQGKKQIYGSQVVPKDDGTMEFYPIEDEEHVNERRKKAGLPPIEEYAKHFGVDIKERGQ